MKRIAIVSLGYMWFPCEAGPSRFYYLAQTLVRQGWEVEIITTDFQHFRKEKRDIGKILEQKYPFHITFIHVPPYKRNIDVRRIMSNRIAAGRVKAYLKAGSQKYDAIYVSIPANDIAAAVVKYGQRQGVPCVVDIEDLWPEAMSMLNGSRIFAKFLLYPFKADAEYVYRHAAGIVGTSEEYTMRAFQNMRREIPSATVYVGCDLAVFDEGKEKYGAQIVKGENEFWVMYAGSIGASYDIATLIRCAGRLREAANIRFLILGSGPLEEEMRELAAKGGCMNMTFMGYQPYQKMAAYLSRADVTVNSFVKGAPQSIVNKVGDYLAAGKPMINTLESPEFMQLVEGEGFGMNIEPENEEKLSEAILELYHDRALAMEMGNRARKCAEERFNRRVSYQKIVNLINAAI